MTESPAFTAAKARLIAWLAYDLAQGGPRGRTVHDPYDEARECLSDDIETLLDEVERLTAPIS